MKYEGADLPDDLLYNKDSSWVRVDDGVVTVGINEPVAKAIKEFLFIKLPDKKTLKKGDLYVSLEALKWSGHLTSPVSGDVIEVNEPLYDDPAAINVHPYESWIMRIKLNDKRELDELFAPQDIVEWLDSILKK